MALLERKAKKVQGKGLSVAAWLLPLSGRTGGAQRRPRRQLSTPALPLILEVEARVPDL